jgi:RNA polymerase sigma factor (sigma-70 family)
MKSAPKNRLNSNFVEALYSVGVTAGLSDGQLLDQFLASRNGVNEVAFAALMERHGPMVFQVCSKVLGNSHDAQDAFQATFLVLIRKAESIRKYESVGSWLYGVARLVAMRASTQAARRRRHERLAAERATAESCDEHDQLESWATLYEQIDRMPEKYREPVVLCYLEGLTTEAAAERLGCPKGTILSRLARAKERLRAGLGRGNFSLEAILLAERLPSPTAKTSTSAYLFEGTIRTSLRSAEGLPAATALSSAKAVALANGVILAMMTAKLRIYGSALLTGAFLVIGAHTLGRQLDSAEGKPEPGAAQSGTEKRQPIGDRPATSGKIPYYGRTFAGAGFNEETTLDDGVKRFNERTKTLGVGLNEPPLTRDEVVAAIRGWDSKNNPVDSDTLKSFQRVAETEILPAGSSLHWIARWTGYNGYAFKVWWVDLYLPIVARDPKRDGQNPMIYGYRIRDRKISSRLLTPQEKQRHEKDVERYELEKKSGTPKQH